METRTTWALRELEDMIFRGELKPGTHLKEAELAGRFKLSRSAIREVFRLIERTGLVVTYPHRGVFVRTHTHQEILEMYDVRTLLEESATRDAVLNITMRTIQYLEDLIEKMRQAIAVDDSLAFMYLNNTFHDEIIRHSTNSTLVDLVDQFRKRQFIFCKMALENKGNNSHSNAEHLALLNFIKKGDAEGAALCMREHVVNGKKKYLKMYSVEWADAPKVQPPMRSLTAL